MMYKMAKHIKGNNNKSRFYILLSIKLNILISLGEKISFAKNVILSLDGAYLIIKYTVKLLLQCI